MQFEKDQKSEYKQLFMQIRDFLLADDKVSELKKERITTTTMEVQVCVMLEQYQKVLISVF